jgi:hypothetical protein
VAYSTDPNNRDESNANQAVMTEVMEKKLKPKRKEPLQKRIAAFLDDVNKHNLEAKAKAKAEVEYLHSARIKRQWTLMTKGIDAALAESSDEDENELNII